MLEHPEHPSGNATDPDLSKRVEDKQSSQKQYHDSKRTGERRFNQGDSVYARNFQSGDK